MFAKCFGGVLWLPFQVPSFLLHDLPVGTDDLPSSAESYEENLEQVRLCEPRGLLRLFQHGHFSPEDCFKSSDGPSRLLSQIHLSNSRVHYGPQRFLSSGNGDAREIS